jgi:hypothetical protein
MKLFSLYRVAVVAAAGVLALAGFGSGRAEAQDVFNNFSFTMVPTNGDEACIPGAAGAVTISPLFGQVESMHVEVTGLPANTDFDLFVIQAPTPMFGLAWYLGDMLTDSTGTAVQDFVGRFSIGTFIVAPGQATAPVVLKKPPFPDKPGNLGAEGPVQLYHLGLWFDSPIDAKKAKCAPTVTPFNSTHNAGVQVLNTSQTKFLPPHLGPLGQVIDR